MHEHQRVDTALCNEPRRDHSFAERRGGRKDTHFMFQHRGLVAPLRARRLQDVRGEYGVSLIERPIDRDAGRRDHPGRRCSRRHAGSP